MDTSKDPCEPVDAMLEFVTCVVVESRIHLVTSQGCRAILTAVGCNYCTNITSLEESVHRPARVGEG